MGTQKMSLANIQGKLSRAEMKNIMAGSTYECLITCPSGQMRYQGCNGGPCCGTLNGWVCCGGNWYHTCSF